MIAGTLEIQLLADMARLQKDMNDAKRMIGGAMGAIEKSVSTAKAALGGLIAGLLAGASISMFAQIIKGSIDSAAALHDLSIQTGASVEALSGLVEIGKYSDFSAQQIAGAMTKLAKNMAGATEESKGAGKAIEALGINFDDFKRLSADQQMVTVAKAMNKFEDGTGKAAVAMALYGKEGAQMLPFLKDLASAGELQAKVTSEQAAMADNFGDNLTKVQVSGEAWTKELSMGILPAMHDLSEAWLAATNGSGGLRDQVRQLASDGTLERWTHNAVIGLTYLMDVGQGLISIFPLVGKGIAGVVAATSVGLSAAWEAWQRFQRADFDGAWAALKNGVVGVKAVAADASADIAAIWNQELLGEKIRKGMDDAKKARAETSAEAAKAQLEFTNINGKDKSLEAANKELKEQEKLLAESVGLAGDFYEKWNRLNAMFKAGKISVSELTDAQKVLLDKQPAIKKAMEEYAKAFGDVGKATLDAAEAHTKFIGEMFSGLDKMKAETKAQKEHNARIGLTKEAIAALDATKLEEQATTLEGIAIKKLDRDFDETQYGLYKAQAEELRKLAALKKEGAAKEAYVEQTKAGAEEAKRINEQIGQSLSDEIMRGGKNGFQILEDYAKTLVFRPIIQAIINPVLGAVTGALGLTGAASAATSAAAAGGGVGALGGIMSGISAMSGSFGSGLMSGLSAWGAEGSVMGLLSNGSALFSGGIVNGLGTIAGALGPIALGIGAVMALVKKFDDSGTIHTGGAARASDTGVSAIDARALGFMRIDTSSDTEKMVSGIATSIVGMLNSTATTFGKSAGYTAATAFADDTSKDGAWGALLIEKMGNALVDWDSARESRWAPKEFDNGEAGLKQYVAALSASVRTALDDVGLPGWAQNMLNGLGNTPAIEDLAKVVDQINATQKALVMMGQSIAGFSTLSDSAVSELIKASGGVDALAGAANAFYDGYYTEAEKISTLSRQVEQALSGVGLTMPATREEFRAMVEAQLRLGEAGAPAVAALLKVSTAFGTVADAALNGAESLTAVAQAAEARRQTALGLVDVMFDAVGRAVESEREKITSTYQQSLRTLETEMERVGGSINRLSGLSSALRSTLSQLRSPAEVSAAERSSAQAQISAALAMAKAGGVFPTAASLERALQVVAQPDMDMYGSLVEQQRDLYRTAIDIADLSELTDAQLSIEERTLEALTQQRKDMELVYQAEMQRLDGILLTAQQQVDAIRGVDTSVQSIAAALSGLAGALTAARAVGAGTAGAAASSSSAVTAALAAAYQQSLYRAPDASGLQYWQNQIATGSLDVNGAVWNIANSNEAKVQQLYGSLLNRVGEDAGVAHWTGLLNNGMTLSEAEAHFKASDEYLSKMPKFAHGGRHAGGWRVVGEQGWELEHTGPSTVVSNSDARRMLDMSQLEGEIKTMRDEMKQTQMLVVRNSSSMAKIFEDWDARGMPSIRDEEAA